MVGVAGRSKGCATCKRRRLRVSSCWLLDASNLLSDLASAISDGLIVSAAYVPVGSAKVMSDSQYSSVTTEAIDISVMLASKTPEGRSYYRRNQVFECCKVLLCTTSRQPQQCWISIELPTKITGCTWWSRTLGPLRPFEHPCGHSASAALASLTKTRP